MRIDDFVKPTRWHPDGSRKNLSYRGPAYGQRLEPHQIKAEQSERRSIPASEWGMEIIERTLSG